MFRKEFPRMFELRDQFKPQDPLNSFWRNLDISIQDSVKRMACRPYEAALQSLDSAAWEFLKKEVSIYLTKWDEKNARGQQQLIDLLNQAMAYNFLKGTGCSDISFIPRSEINRIETPDLEGRLGHIKVICEVKTINISEDEAFIRREMFLSCCPRCDQPQRKLEQGFFNKLKHNITKAINQIEVYAAGNETRDIVYIITNYDDFWGERKEEYYQQIDEYLCDNIIQGIEIVFHNQRTAFHKAITMKYATIFNEPEYF
jgi:hypothetical protein